MMLEEDSEAEPGQQSDNEVDFTELISIPTKKVEVTQFSVTKQKKKEVEQITKQVNIVDTYNNHISLTNHPQQFSYKVQVTPKQNNNPKSFMKPTDSEILAQIFAAILETVKSKELIRKITDKCTDQVMVVRVTEVEIDKNSKEIRIEDETGQALLEVNQGYFWLGMIIVIRAEWQGSHYILKQVLQPHLDKNVSKVGVNNLAKCHRITVAKGPFTLTKSQQLGFLSLHLLIHEIKRNHTATLILLGPFLSQKQMMVHSQTLEKDYDFFIKNIFATLSNQIPNVKLVLVPSTEDVFHIYPLPQPKLQIKGQRLYFTQNPVTISLMDAEKKLNTFMNIINTDFAKFIENNSKGSVKSNLLQKIYEEYLKQKFILTGSEQPFDQESLPTLFNNGNFGEIIIYGSYQKVPRVTQIGHHLFINVGSILQDENENSRLGFYTQINIFQADNKYLHEKTRIDIKKINY